MEKHEIVSLIVEVTADLRSKLSATRELTLMAFFSSLHSLNADDSRKIISTTKERMSRIINDQIIVMNTDEEHSTNYNLAKHLKEETESFLENIKKWEEQMKEQGRL